MHCKSNVLITDRRPFPLSHHHTTHHTPSRCKLKQRLQDAHDLLSMTSLWGEAYKDFDLQHQHHVTLFLGAFVLYLRACYHPVGVV